MTKRQAYHHINYLSGYACGYGLAAATFTGNWWWMLLWLSIIICAAVEVFIIDGAKWLK